MLFYSNLFFSPHLFFYHHFSYPYSILSHVFPFHLIPISYSILISSHTYLILYSYYIVASSQPISFLLLILFIHRFSTLSTPLSCHSLSANTISLFHDKISSFSSSHLFFILLSSFVAVILLLRPNGLIHT